MWNSCTWSISCKSTVSTQCCTASKSWSALCGGNDEESAQGEQGSRKNVQIYLFAKLIGTPTLFKDKDIQAMQDFAKNYYGKKNQSLT